MSDKLAALWPILALDGVGDALGDARPLFVVDRGGARLRYANPAGARFLGLAPEAVLEAPLSLEPRFAERLARFAAAAAPGAETRELMRMPAGARAALVSALFRRPQGADDAVVVTLDGTRPDAADADPALALAPIAAQGGLTALFGRDGDVLAALGDHGLLAGLQDEVEAALDADIDEAVFERRLNVADHAHDIALVRLDDGAEPRRLLHVGPARPLVAEPTETADEADPIWTDVPTEVESTGHAAPLAAPAEAHPTAELHEPHAPVAAPAEPIEPAPEHTGTPAAEPLATLATEAEHTIEAVAEQALETVATHTTAPTAEASHSVAEAVAAENLAASLDAESLAALLDAETTHPAAPAEPEAPIAATVTGEVPADVPFDAIAAPVTPDAAPSAPVAEAPAALLAAPEAPVAEAPAEANEEPRRLPERSVKFVWQMDAERRFTLISDDFAAVVGPHAADLVGHAWEDVAVRLGLDPEGRVAAALARRDTWSGRTVLWPVEGAALRVPVDLAALPAFDRGRIFAGYRGFGTVRGGEAVPDPTAAGLRLAAAEVVPPETVASEVHAPAGSVASTALEAAAPLAALAATAVAASTEHAAPAESLVPTTAHDGETAAHVAAVEAAAAAFEPVALEPAVADHLAAADHAVAPAHAFPADGGVDSPLAIEEDDHELALAMATLPACDDDGSFAGETAEPLEPAAAEATAPHATDVEATAVEPAEPASAPAEHHEPVSPLALLAADVEAEHLAEAHDHPAATEPHAAETAVHHGEAEELGAPVAEPAAAPADQTRAAETAGEAPAGSLVQGEAAEHAIEAAAPAETTAHTDEAAPVAAEHGEPAPAPASTHPTAAEEPTAFGLWNAGEWDAAEPLALAPRNEAAPVEAATVHPTDYDAAATAHPTAHDAAPVVHPTSHDAASAVHPAEPAPDEVQAPSPVEPSHAVMPTHPVEAGSDETAPAAEAAVKAPEAPIEPHPVEAPIEPHPVEPSASLEPRPAEPSAPVPLRPLALAAVDPARPVADPSGLSQPERVAFRQIAEALGARIEGEDAPARPQTQAAAHPSEPAPQHLVAEPAPAAAPGSEAPASEAPRAAVDTRLLDRLASPVAVVKDDNLVYANDAFLRLLAYPDLEALEAEGGLDALFAGEHVARRWAAGPDGSRPVPVLARDGRVVPVDASVATVPWAGGSALMLTITEVAVRPATEAADEAETAEVPTEAPVAAPSTPAALAAAMPSEPAAHAPAAEPEPRPQPAPAPLAAPLGDVDAARERVAELEAIVDTATDGVLMLDADGVILSANHAAEALFGIDRAEMIGRPLTDRLAPESRRSAVDYLDGLARNGVASVLNDGREVIGAVDRGGLIPLFMTIGRISSGSTRKYCAVLRDITHWKKSEEDLTAARRKAEEASVHKSDFLAKISHEIRTPLNAIIGFSEVMIDERFGPVGNDRYKDYLRDIHASGSHIMSLINDLLDLSKVEAGKMDLRFEAVSLADVMSECVAMMQPQANRERIIIRSSLPVGVPAVVADPRSVRQVILNLLSNAIKFTPAGGQVIVSTTLEDSGEVVMRVRDTGYGMTDKELQTAMEPFRQLHTTRSRGGGTGLGLPLTKALVEANRAVFRIDSTVGQGTLVTVTFPVTRVLAS